MMIPCSQLGEEGQIVEGDNGVIFGPGWGGWGREGYTYRLTTGTSRILT